MSTTTLRQPRNASAPAAHRPRKVRRGAPVRPATRRKARLDRLAPADRQAAGQSSVRGLAVPATRPVPVPSLRQPVGSPARRAPGRVLPLSTPPGPHAQSVMDRSLTGSEVHWCAPVRESAGAGLVAVPDWAPAPARVRPGVELTRRGRLLLTTAAVTLTLAAFTVVGAQAAATSEAGISVATHSVMVGQGDTLWGIASAVASPGQVRETVLQIEQLNHLSGPELVPGQELAVPTR